MTDVSDTQPCAAWECANNTATHEKPLCYEHWLDWESGSLEECGRCHWLHGFEAIVFNEWSGDFVETAGKVLGDQDGFLCFHCTIVTLDKSGKLEEAFQTMRSDTAEVARDLYAEELQTKVPPCPPRVELGRQARYVYILKNNDASFYVGQTIELALRLEEHRDGRQAQTRGKDPKLVYFEEFVGVRDEVNLREGELAQLSQSGVGQRQLRRLIEQFRVPLRLIDLDA